MSLVETAVNALVRGYLAKANLLGMEAELLEPVHHVSDEVEKADEDTLEKTPYPAEEIR